MSPTHSTTCWSDTGVCSVINAPQEVIPVCDHQTSRPLPSKCRTISANRLTLTQTHRLHSCQHILILTLFHIFSYFSFIYMLSHNAHIFYYIIYVAYLYYLILHFSMPVCIYILQTLLSLNSYMLLLPYPLFFRFHCILLSILAYNVSNKH